MLLIFLIYGVFLFPKTILSTYRFFWRCEPTVFFVAWITKKRWNQMLIYVHILRVQFYLNWNIIPHEVFCNTKWDQFWNNANKGDGNIRQNRNKAVYFGNTESTLVVSIFLYSFVLLPSVVPVSMHYRLSSVAFRMKVLQNGRLVRFWRRTNYWCAFSWSICNQIGQFIRCIQRSCLKECHPLCVYQNYSRSMIKE